VDSYFLDAMAIRLVRGRNFEPREQGVAIVSESAARVLWSKADPLRKSLPWDVHGATVIGVARDASTDAMSDADPLQFYTPLGEDEASESTLLLRVTGDPHLLTRRLQDAARGVDATLQPSVKVVTDAYDEEVHHVSRALAVITLLGTAAVLLSIVGLAGLAGYTVAQRTREIGLRIALGARPRQIIASLLGPMIRPISFGLACGAMGGAVVTKVLRAATPALAGMNLFDPRAYLISAAVFAGVIALSVLAPGHRAIRINPSRALAHE